MLITGDHVQATPPGRLPYYPTGGSLKEIPEEPFPAADEFEPQEQNLDWALEISRALGLGRSAGACRRMAAPGADPAQAQPA